MRIRQRTGVRRGEVCGYVFLQRGVVSRGWKFKEIKPDVGLGRVESWMQTGNGW